VCSRVPFAWRRESAFHPPSVTAGGYGSRDKLAPLPNTERVLERVLHTQPRHIHGRHRDGAVNGEEQHDVADVGDVVPFWAVSLVEPLLSLRRRNALERSLQLLCQARPGWAAIWLPGTIADIVLTLPAADDWRNLSARVVRAEGQDLLRHGGAEPPDTTGATGPGGRAFGTWRDSADLARPLFTAVAQDSALAALDEPLSAASAALLAFCADGWDAGRAAVVALAADEGDPDAVYRIGVPALLWAVHRRRAYLGPEDMWPVESSFVWSFRAEQVESGLDWDAEDMRRAIAQESVTEQDMGRRPQNGHPDR